MDRSELVAISWLAIMDLLFTAWGIKHGLRELNPFINAFSLWVYPLLYLLGLAACHVLDKVAERMGVDFRPSRLFILIYIITVGNNAVVMSVT